MKYVNKAGVRKLLQEQKGYNVSEAVFDELEVRVHEVLERAATRARRNQRKTVMGRDI